MSPLWGEVLLTGRCNGPSLLERRHYLTSDSTNMSPLRGEVLLTGLYSSSGVGGVICHPIYKHIIATWRGQFYKHFDLRGDDRPQAGDDLLMYAV